MALLGVQMEPETLIVAPAKRCGYLSGASSSTPDKAFICLLGSDCCICPFSSPGFHDVTKYALFKMAYGA